MHPYSRLPDRNFWKRAVSETPWRNLRLNDNPRFVLDRQCRIASAGSCFAQHISRYLRRAGIKPFIAESEHPLMAESGVDCESYRKFSARYGNVYTVRQCLEMLRQAVGEIPLIEDFVEQDGRWHDLLRPNVEKFGYATLYEAQADRRFHIGRVKYMFQKADVFIFTLGLTEGWYHANMGHTYPVCPGTVRGVYDPDLHLFHNFSVTEVSADLKALIGGLQAINPTMKIILTVSPVPLAATYTDNNVLVASSLSKSILRVAAGEVISLFENVAYFPSYEIISSPASFGQYLSSDLRNVTERGIAHVMDCFIQSYFTLPHVAEPLPTEVDDDRCLSFCHINDQLPECDELFNEPS